MSEPNNTPPSPEALQRTLNEMLASESILEGRNGRQLQSTVESVILELLSDTQFKTKLQGETKIGFGMALGKFLAWKVWSELEKADKKRLSQKSQDKTLTLHLPEHLLSDVKEQWPKVQHNFFERVGFELPQATLEPSDGDWVLEHRGGLLGHFVFEGDWFEPLVKFLGRQSSRLLSLGLVKQLVEEVRHEEPAIAEELERIRTPLTAIYRVLESLLEENVPIHQMPSILTAIVLNWEPGLERRALLSRVRLALSPWICKSVQAKPGLLRALRIGRRIDELFAESLSYIGHEQVFALDPQQRALIAVLVKQAVIRLGGTDRLVVIANQRIRQELHRLLQVELPGLVVLSESEIHSGFRVQTLAVVDFKETKKSRPAEDKSAESSLSFL